MAVLAQQVLRHEADHMIHVLFNNHKGKNITPLPQKLKRINNQRHTYTEKIVPEMFNN